MTSPRQGAPPVVAILNSNDDTVEMLRMMIESSGMVAVSAHISDIRRGVFDFSGFVKEHDPEVIIYDVIPPYDRSWLMFQHLRATDVVSGRKFVLTSTNPGRLREFVDPGQEVFEIIGKPYDLQMIVDAVKKALG